MIKKYFKLTKPGILFGNAITAAGGFALASNEHINFRLLFATLIGLCLIMASACVFNNYMDRHMDAKMARTKNRALVKGSISLRNALIFAVILLLSGILVLALFDNFLTLLVALTGYFVYVVIYSIWKYRTAHATLIGSIAGGTPPLVGYCAVSNHFDLAALLLFLIIVLWQMPHFFSIAIYRMEEYVAACIPVLPIKKGIYITKIHMLLYIIAFIFTALMLTIFDYTGYLYLITATVMGFLWLGLWLKGLKVSNDKQWARSMFHLSLVIITTLSVAISVS